MATTTVDVRMYNPGFGDAFVITVKRARKTWRMLVDCGVHNSGQARPISEVVEQMITDLKAANKGVAHLDLVVLTHNHSDHVIGFADEAWKQVTVDEVWLPYIENKDDDTTKVLRPVHDATVQKLAGLIGRATLAAAGDKKAAERLELAKELIDNSTPKENARDRLFNGDFKTKSRVRFMPDLDATQNLIQTPISDVRIRVLGPSRDPKQIKRMDPGVNEQWASLAAASLDRGESTTRPMFAAAYERPAETVPAEWIAEVEKMRLPQLLDPSSLILAAAAGAESWVNNTSVIFLLEAGPFKLLFVGDAQQGAWEHLLDDPETSALLNDIDFYKVGHHGSLNATPMRWVNGGLTDKPKFGMMGYKFIKTFASIPNDDMVTHLKSHNLTLVRADEHAAAKGVLVEGDIWTEVSFPAKK